MRRETLNEYVDDIVTITLNDGTEAFGKLCFSDELCEKNNWVPAGNYYIWANEIVVMCFKPSHVKKLRIF